MALEIFALWSSDQQYVSLEISALRCKSISSLTKCLVLGSYTKQFILKHTIKHWNSKYFPSIDEYYAPLEINRRLQGSTLQHYPKVWVFDLILLSFFAQWLGFWPHIHLKSRYAKDQFWYIKTQHETLGNKTHTLCSYSPVPRMKIYCLSLNLNILKLVYFIYVSVLASCFVHLNKVQPELEPRH